MVSIDLCTFCALVGAFVLGVIAAQWYNKIKKDNPYADAV